MLLEDIRPQVRQDKSAERLYHKDVGFPKDVKMPQGFSPMVRLRYGTHARQEAFADRYGILDLPETIDIRKADIVEIGVTGNTVTKIVARIPHDEKKDIVIVFLPADGFVKTVWANEKNDNHKSLNKSKYVDPNRQRF